MNSLALARSALAGLWFAKSLSAFPNGSSPITQPKVATQALPWVHVRTRLNCDRQRGGSERSVIGEDVELEVGGLEMKGRISELLTKRCQAWRPR
jgi:hypothetical protein